MTAYRPGAFRPADTPPTAGGSSSPRRYHPRAVMLAVAILLAVEVGLGVAINLALRATIR